MVNKVILIGRLGKDVDYKPNTEGKEIARFSLGVNKYTKGPTGEKEKKTNWCNIVCFSKTAQIASKLLRKGSQVYIEGELVNRSYEDSSGLKRYVTEIKARDLQALSSPQEKPVEKPKEEYDPGYSYNTYSNNNASRNNNYNALPF